MMLAELISVLRAHDLVITAPDAVLEIDSLAVDSRTVQPGACFIAARGAVADGHDFIMSAIDAGASAVIAEHPIAVAVPVVVVNDGRRATEVLATTWYRRPTDSLTIVGITGTNGKTTTTAIMRHLMAGSSVAGSIGTLGAFGGDGKRIPSTAGTLTTPGPLDLQATFRSMVDSGVRNVAMEASSHALHQRRLDGVTFAGGVFTNLTREHLDYHGTMAEYVDAKLRLADLVAGDGVLSINADDPAWAPLVGDRRAITWGVHPDAQVRIGDITLLTAGSRFTIDGRFGRADVELPLPGDFNVSNAAAGAAVMLGMGHSLDTVAARLTTAPQVLGRMERIIDFPFFVMRDYAHTPDGLERALRTLRAITPGRLLLVFGCGGERDRGKRAVMGSIAAAGSDHVFVTSDNPRHEDPEQIMDDIVSGMPAGSYDREIDRLIAIGLATGEARAGDAILLAGKGHETYQIIGDDYTPFDERAIVLGLVR